MGSRSRNTCRKLFKELKISPLQLQYILSLLLFVDNNKNQRKVNLRSTVLILHKTNLYQPSNLTTHQKGTN